MQLNDLSPAKGSRHSRKRVGRGDGSGLGRTSGKGEKGQNARSGGGVRLGFEGGQMPLIRRVPKRGFVNIFSKKYSIVNIKGLEKLKAGTEVTPQILKEEGIVSSLKNPIKLLAQGDLSVSLHLKVHACSRGAQEKIEKAGGKVEII